MTDIAAPQPRLVQISGFWNDNQPWTRQVIVMPVDEATWRRIGEANSAE